MSHVLPSCCRRWRTARLSRRASRQACAVASANALKAKCGRSFARQWRDERAFGEHQIGPLGDAEIDRPSPTTMRTWPTAASANWHLQLPDERAAVVAGMRERQAPAVAAEPAPDDWRGTAGQCRAAGQDGADRPVEAVGDDRHAMALLVAQLDERREARIDVDAARRSRPSRRASRAPDRSGAPGTRASRSGRPSSPPRSPASWIGEPLEQQIGGIEGRDGAVEIHKHMAIHTRHSTRQHQLVDWLPANWERGPHHPKLLSPLWCDANYVPMVFVNECVRPANGMPAWFRTDDPAQIGEAVGIESLILKRGIAPWSERQPLRPSASQCRGQFCMPHLRTVAASRLRKIRFSTRSPIRMTVNRPANTVGISSWFLPHK